MPHLRGLEPLPRSEEIGSRGAVASRIDVGEVADMRAATLEKGMLITVGGEITAGGPEARDTGANRFNIDSVPPAANPITSAGV